MKQERAKELADLAEKVLNEQGQQDVQDLLEEDDERGAVEYLLGAVDHCYKDGLGDATAAEYYRVLNVSPDRASSIRQSSGKL